MSTGFDESPSLYAIVLAAGASSRFGSPKQLVRVDGRPLLHAVVSRTVEITGHCTLVVLGANAADLAPLLRHSPATIVINRDWSEGLASSIRTGVSALPGSCTGVMLVLADQAAVTAEDLRRLAGTWRRQPTHMVAAQYSRRPCHLSELGFQRSPGSPRRPRGQCPLPPQSGPGGAGAHGKWRRRHRHARRPAAASPRQSLIERASSPIVQRTGTKRLDGPA
jgi:CTP:molybdopterin cytidylyltransferase MocA